MTTRVTVPEVMAAKGNRKLTELTAYDYPTAHWVDQSGIDMILVGDSLAMVVLGQEDTLSVGMDEMIHHTRAVSRAARRALVIGDMPFLSYQAGVEQAVMNAGRFLKEGRAQAVKLEGGRKVVPQVRAIVDAGIPVQGHIGLTPQSVAQMGGFKVQGKTAEAARAL
ncbi:MAG: 3-methyl-2-oxobutanoate hydroxymethyltransferase, partial [Syntrophobacteraceae bacterium]|nr:3-methyl-2-oxobutanoate hydroxymethyltransferase [Syntrophobacteraceae bacterium]